MAKTPTSYLYARVTQDSYGLKRPKMAGQKPKYKAYKEGVTVTGYEFNQSDLPDHYIPAFITKDGYEIALANLFVLGEQQEAIIVEEKSAMTEALKDKMKRFSMMDGSLAGGQQRISKYSVTGAMIAGAVFYLYAAAKGKPKTAYGLMGVLVGGLAGKIAAQYRNNNE